MPRLLACLLVAATALLAGCDAGAPGGGDPDRVVLMTIRLENTEDSGDAVTITARDRDGDGTFSFTPRRMTLRRGGDYEGTVEALETAGGEDLVATIRAAPDEYVFSYHMWTDDGFNVVNSPAFASDRETDYDPEGREEWPVGLRFRLGVTPVSSGSGTFSADLRRYESGAKEANSTRYVMIDLQFAFPVRVVDPSAGAQAPGP